MSDQVVDVVFKEALDGWLVTSVLAASTGNMFVDLDENDTPHNPASDDARLYAQDVAGEAKGASGDTVVVNVGAAVSTGIAVVTITGSKAFQIRHRVATTCVGGIRANFGTEVYTRVVVGRA